MASRKETSAKLEAMATKKPKLSGIKNMALTSKIALGILVVVVLLSVLASLIAPYDPFEIGMARMAPDGAHLVEWDGLVARRILDVAGMVLQYSV